MDATSTIAARTYSAARPATAPATDGAGREGLASLAGDFAETLQRGENAAEAAMAGDADPQALVQALAESELAVETAVTIRDKMVEAYQEILRMPV
ncbi:flagellar hook-basal body protein FliE [Rhodobacteraceae bacterium WD3A24]|nr:flagellar hook-basal body protein FliE [Rhodobacteraceae bacterium WD3A24]